MASLGYAEYVTKRRDRGHVVRTRTDRAFSGRSGTDLESTLARQPLNMDLRMSRHVTRTCLCVGLSRALCGLHSTQKPRCPSIC
jgi:hypothetical protein